MAVSLPPQPWTEGMSFVVDETGLEYTFNGEVWLSEGEPLDLSQYATKDELSEVKGDVESIQLELELLATTLESGTWRNIANPAPRAGEMWLAFNDFSVQQNQLIINNEDANGKTHGWVSLHEGDYVEMLDRSDTSRTVEHDYGLFMVTTVDKGDGITTIGLELHSGQGTCQEDELYEVRVLDIAESELDMAALDERYSQKSHGHNYASSSHTHSYASTSHKHDSDYSASNHTHSVIFRSGTTTNPSLSKGEPFLNTTYKVIYVGT